ncbi:hypothetical protein DBO95_09685 [Yersinia pestis]|nr:hypothetical protein DBO95_09685 [Yersinia pestis]
MITHVSPLGSMDLLSQLEVDMLKRTASSDLYRLFRNCSLAVLNSGSLTDNSKELLSRNETFDINVLRRERGVKLELVNPPDMRLLTAKLFAHYKQPVRGITRYLICQWSNRQCEQLPAFEYGELQSFD